MKSYKNSQLQQTPPTFFMQFLRYGVKVLSVIYKQNFLTLSGSY